MNVPGLLLLFLFVLNTLVLHVDCDTDDRLLITEDTRETREPHRPSFDHDAGSTESDEGTALTLNLEFFSSSQNMINAVSTLSPIFTDPRTSGTRGKHTHSEERLQQFLFTAVPDSSLSLSEVETLLTRMEALDFRDVFYEWLQMHDKSYSVTEVFHRLDVFKRNAIDIFRHNTQSERPSYFQHINRFSDLTWEEFQQKRISSERTNPQLRANPSPGTDDNSGRNYSTDAIDADADILPAGSELDWVSKGAVTPVQDQGDCGACWSFASIGAIEGSYAVQTGELVQLSAQQLIDCVQVANGCEGGDEAKVMQFLARFDDDGICLSASYPYTEKNKKCDMDCIPRVRVTGLVKAEPANEVGLANALMQRPVAVGIYLSRSAQHYESGIIDSDCGDWGDGTNHAVVGVGYGGGLDEQPFWRFKNSFGVKWGEEGYFRVVRGVSMCNIGQMSSFPYVEPVDEF